MVTLRTYRPDDAPALLTVFRDTIRRVNSRDYTPDQIRAWAADYIDPQVWAGRFAGPFVAVAEEAGRSVGFVDLEASGHIDRVYVSAAGEKRGHRRLQPVCQSAGQPRADVRSGQRPICVADCRSGLVSRRRANGGRIHFCRLVSCSCLRHFVASSFLPQAS